jgi:hypothetical protein
MKRRQFIGMAAASAAGLVCPATAGIREFDAWSILAAPRLLDVLHDPHVVRDIGRRYRDTVPAEDNVAALVEAVCDDLRIDLKTTSPASLVTRVNDHVQRDFASDRTLTLNGWILSVTEARQCALFSLVSL